MNEYKKIGPVEISAYLLPKLSDYKGSTESEWIELPLSEFDPLDYPKSYWITINYPPES